MNDKYSPAKCAQYGRRLATRLCDQHFGAQPNATFDGPALLHFTPIRQLNLLVLRQLLAQWQAEATRLQSPYFDFAAAPVQTALAQLMNALSRHIRLGRAALEPLLAQATADALTLATDPTAAAEHLLFRAPAPLTVASLRDKLRYFDLDKAFYQGFVEDLPASSEALDADFLRRRFAEYHAAHYKAHEPAQHLIELLSNLLPLTAADLLEEDELATELPAVAPVPVAVPVAATPAAALATTSPQAVASDTSAPVVPLYEKLKAAHHDAPPLVETLRAAVASPRSVEQGAPKVETLRAAISINQRFSFINELFNGENMEYHTAIQHLDSLPDAEQAYAYLTNDLAPRFDWAGKEEHVGKLLKLIERKFA